MKSIKFKNLTSFFLTYIDWIILLDFYLSVCANLSQLEFYLLLLIKRILWFPAFSFFLAHENPVLI